MRTLVPKGWYSTDCYSFGPSASYFYSKAVSCSENLRIKPPLWLWTVVGSGPGAQSWLEMKMNPPSGSALSRAFKILHDGNLGSPFCSLPIFSSISSLNSKAARGSQCNKEKLWESSFSTFLLKVILFQTGLLGSLWLRGDKFCVFQIIWTTQKGGNLPN